MFDTDRPVYVDSWPQFSQHWGGLYNFLLDTDLTGFEYQPPPLERIVEEVRASPSAIVRSGIKGDAFDQTDIRDQFRAMPLAQALHSRFVLAHFRLVPELSGPGQLFEGIEELWVQPWKQKLLAHGFSFECVFPILFASGPHSASNYHLDKTHQLAWQCYGTKHFHGLIDPDRWTTTEQRAHCSLENSVKPGGINEADTYTVNQPSGSVLWNSVSIPHWVETFGCTAATLTLVHQQLRYNGKLSRHAEEREIFLRARPKST